jgi:hypothetical protein
MPGISGDVRVQDGRIAFDLPEEVYEERGYSPSLVDVPWKAQYEAEQKRAASFPNLYRVERQFQPGL